MSAITETFQLEDTIDFYSDVCGEIVHFSGIIRTLFHLTINNNQILIKEQAKPEGLIGSGLTSGVIYHGVGVTQTIESIKSLPFEGTYVNNFRLISEGSTNNLQIHETIHLTINANGDITAYVDNFSAKCNG